LKPSLLASMSIQHPAKAEMKNVRSSLNLDLGLLRLLSP
jgi:hypothetical protein